MKVLNNSTNGVIEFRREDDTIIEALVKSNITKVAYKGVTSRPRTFVTNEVKRAALFEVNIFLVGGDCIDIYLASDRTDGENQYVSNQIGWINGESGAQQAVEDIISWLS